MKKVASYVFLLVFTILLFGCRASNEEHQKTDNIQLNCILYELTSQEYTYENSDDHVYFIGFTSNQDMKIAQDPFSSIKDSYIHMETGFTDTLLQGKTANTEFLYERYIHTNDDIDSIRDRIVNTEVSVYNNEVEMKLKVLVITTLA